ncbi:DUF1853 family protein [Pontimicrobium sp. MEBiC01747]
MTDKTEDLQPQFSGFFNTPHLFLNSINGIYPFIDTLNYTPVFGNSILKNIRLGQRVERFVSKELQEHDSITILAENPQIKNGKVTIGELDCLFIQNKQPIHLEIQFKYYLFDPNLGTTEIDHCIGPMRKDSLNEKLNKLKTKQLPLLYAPETKPVLEKLNLKANDFVQQIYFKAQIFMPFEKSYVLKTLNPKCVYGFYFKYKTLPFFKDYKFYIPKKTDWLLDVTPNVDWQTYDAVLPKLKVYENEGYSPMLWLKHPKGHLDKCFVVAW